MEKQVNTQPERPMKWHKFLIYFLLWFSAIANIVSGFQAISGSQYGASANRVYSNFPGLKTIDIIFGLFVLFIAVFTIVTRFKLAGFKADGPKYLILVYIMSAAVSIVYILAVIANTPLTMGDFGSQLIGQIIGPVIMVAINRTYYNNRADLFVN